MMLLRKKISLLIVLLFLFACGKNSESGSNNSVAKSDDTASAETKSDSENKASDSTTEESGKDVETGSELNPTGDQTSEENSGKTEEKKPEESKPVVSKPFSAGPYGTSYGSIAGDFSVNTLKGKLTFKDVWTGDDHFVFVFYNASNAYFNQFMDF